MNTEYESRDTFRGHNFVHNSQKRHASTVRSSCIVKVFTTHTLPGQCGHYAGVFLGCQEAADRLVEIRLRRRNP